MKQIIFWALVLGLLLLYIERLGYTPSEIQTNNLDIGTNTPAIIRGR